MPTSATKLRKAVLRHHFVHYQQQHTPHHLHPQHRHLHGHFPRHDHLPVQTRTQEEEELLWEDLFSKPLDWADYRQRKRTSLHPDFRHKTSKAPLWLNSMCKPHWVDSRLAVPGPGNPPEEDDVRKLCSKGDLDLAMDALSHMDYNGFTPSDALYTVILKACLKWKALSHAIYISAHIFRRKTELCKLLQDAVIITLAKCGGLVHALNLLYTLPHCTIESWTAVIDGFVECGRYRDAFITFSQMQELNLQPNLKMFASLFKACGSLGNLEEGRWLHADGEMKGFTLVPAIGTALVNMYSNCESILEAESVFCTMLQQDALSRNEILSAYVEHGFWDKAILAYRQTREERWNPDALTYTIVLRACGFLGEEERLSFERQPTGGIFLEIGRALHGDIRASGFASDTSIGSALIVMYGKCGSMSEALNVFEGFSEFDIAPWSAMLSAYVQQGQGAEAIAAYRKLHEYGLIPDVHIFVLSIRACIILLENEEATPTALLEIGEALSEDVRTKGFAANTVIRNTLVSMYGKCGNILGAENVFVELIGWDVVSWNAMLSVYIQHGQVSKSFLLYRQMVAEGVTANVLSYVLCFQACGVLAEHENRVCKQHYGLDPVSIKVAHALHAFVRREGYYTSTFICNALITMYGKCGRLLEAEYVFCSSAVVDVVSWNAMLSAYVENCRGHKALQLYTRMLEVGEYPNKLTFVIALQACITFAEQEGEFSDVVALEVGHALHTDILCEGCMSDDAICSTLVSLYGKCGAVGDAETVFSRLMHSNLVPWNAMLSSYVEQGHDDKALYLLNQMEREGMPIDEIAMVCTLQVCGRLGSVEMCRQLFFKVISIAFDTSPNSINTSIHSFGHCSSNEDANVVFFQLHQPHKVAWNAWIACYAQEGDFEGSLIAFQNMQLAGIKPDAFTYLSLLCGCSHVGLVESSIEVFESMKRDFQLSPDVKHYSAMIDILGRTGNFKMVKHLLSAMPVQANLPLWLSLLGACRTHGNVELAKEAFKQAVDLQPSYAAAYVLISNIHVTDCAQESSDIERLFELQKGCMLSCGQCLKCQSYNGP